MYEQKNCFHDPETEQNGTGNKPHRTGRGILQISQRTIRNDLNAINDLLTEQGLVNLKLGRGGGNHPTIREQKAGIK